MALPPLRIALADHGAGNLTSLCEAFRRLGHRPIIARTPEGLAGSDAVVLAGVGAFPKALATLEERGLVEAILSRAAAGHPVLGICLGMQLLAQSSLELGMNRGLGLLPGHVVPLPAGDTHIGWNRLIATDESRLSCDMAGIWVYFNHGFGILAPPDGPGPRGDAGAGDGAVALVNAGTARIVAVSRQQKVVGMQFHPERSQDAGQTLLKRVLEELCRAD